jgi:hypothetical protein
MNRLVRPCCSECSGPIRWYQEADLDSDDVRAVWQEMQDRTAGPVQELWICLLCGEAGAMFDWQSSELDAS